MAKRATKAHTDVGHILVQVQEDLKELKEKISHITIQNEGEAVDIQSLETAIHRTEIGLKRHAAEYLNSINRQVLTLPAVEYRDLPAGCSLADAIQSANSKIVKKRDVYPSLCQKHQGPQLENAPRHISPGIQHKLAMDMKILRDPTHPKNRSVLNENYGLQLPVIRSTVPEAPLQKLAKGTTVAPLTVLPSSHREDPSLLPPFVSEKDAKKGILSLTERGLIPPAAGLSLDPPPIQHKVAIMHDSQEKYRKPPPEIYGSYPQKSYYIVISETSTDEPDHRGMLNSRALLKKGTIIPAPSMMTTLPTKDINAVQHLHDKQMVPYEFHEPKHLAANWNHIKASRRTIIHIPSLGYAQWLRSTVPDIDTQQNLQMGRLCDIRDDNIDVIYICPLWIGEEVTQYYMNLLGLQEAVRLGKPEVMVDMTDRLKVITPEATRHFPTHHLCLATHLKYSPQAIQRIKNLIEGKAAYIVGGLLHQDDLAVADMLNVPILGPEPEVAHLYSTKSGSKRIFASVSVPVPPGEYDIYNLQQMHEVLIQLILENLEIKRWLFKMDTEFGGRGTAYFDVSHLPCYHQTLKEFRKVGLSVWLKRRWIQEPSEIKMAKELPGVLAEHARPVNQEIFPTWEKFLKMFLCQGGVVEAYPPSNSVTNLTVDMLIEPTGEISMISCGDQIHSRSPLECWGTTVPQCSVDPGNLHSMCVKIAEACKCRGVLGFFSIDLVTFIHPYTMEQQVWATDLDLAYSDQLAMTQLMLFISNGKLTCASNSFEVPPRPKEKKGRLHRQEVAKEVEMQTQLPFMKRYGVLSTQLKHANLSMVHYSVLFKIFKAHGIGFDIKERQGTVFILHEGNKRDRLGMVTIGEDLQGALLTFARNLSVIHQEITAPNVHWENNFQAAIKDIEVILGVTIVNKSKEDRSAPPLEAMT
ncbi:IQ motif-containing protein H isoform X7 [Mobula birostris]|uniref:IQ motif-containing protein H isoform X7 n=1 Tax=Mobula birostris TaxID=1983395 RepID=UPI003B285C7C